MSATKTAEAARLAALTASAELADATSDTSLAEVNEAIAHQGYRAAVDRAREST